MIGTFYMILSWYYDFNRLQRSHIVTLEFEFGGIYGNNEVPLFHHVESVSGPH